MTAAEWLAYDDPGVMLHSFRARRCPATDHGRKTGSTTYEKPQAIGGSSVVRGLFEKCANWYTSSCVILV